MGEEVKREVEVIEKVSENADAIVVPAPDKDQLDKDFNKGGGDTFNNSISATSVDNSSSPELDDPSKPKPVDGETPKEYSLRKEVEALREERRQAKQERIAGIARPPTQKVADERMTRLKSIYSNEEIQNMEEAIDVIATNRGYIKREETYQGTVNGIVDEFIENHPEYKPNNDKDDVRWNKFQETLLSDYNLLEKTPKQLSQIFAKVNRDVIQELGESDVKNNPNKLNAQLQKIKSVSHAGGTSASSSSKPNLDPSVRKMFKGFDEEDFKS